MTSRTEPTAWVVHAAIRPSATVPSWVSTPSGEASEKSPAGLGAPPVGHWTTSATAVATAPRKSAIASTTRDGVQAVVRGSSRSRSGRSSGGPECPCRWECPCGSA